MPIEIRLCRKCSPSHTTILRLLENAAARKVSDALLMLSELVSHLFLLLADAPSIVQCFSLEFLRSRLSRFFLPAPRLQCLMALRLNRAVTVGSNSMMYGVGAAPWHILGPRLPAEVIYDMLVVRALGHACPHWSLTSRSLPALCDMLANTGS